MENPFSIRSCDYAAYRPVYPTELYDWIVAAAPAAGAAWDCATGNGQCAKALADRFGTVVGTDVSAEQIGAAQAKRNLKYLVSPAEKTPFSSNTFDVVTVAQALHWFDYEQFWPEVSRVLKPGGFFCAWAYNWLEGDPALDTYLMEPFLDILKPFWSEKNAIAWRGYQNEEIRFPFKRLKTPEFSIALSLTIGQTINYLQTWSAYKRAICAPHHADNIKTLLDEACKRWPNDHLFQLTHPLVLVAGYNLEP